MSLETLPVELIELVADNLVFIGDLGALSRTSRRLHLVVDHRLYARDAKHDRKALEWSIRKGSFSVLKKTIQHGADVNKGDDSLIPCEPLTMASGNHHVEIVKLLLEHGADPNPPGPRGFSYTPLSAAAGSGCYEIVKILIEAGADVRATTRYEWGPVALSRAMTVDQNDDIIRLLLEKGALNDMPEHFLRSSFSSRRASIRSVGILTASLHRWWRWKRHPKILPFSYWK
ncbi:hypothetical protein CEP54_012539 [Fusarium duplospermum]|uniref:Uncharacterized protein n=1 Tax=Fusarium duplospermum TaxID=1325734 RepID=A0A428P889_9HYPO|nr:hypothetical protein CEP54_012539 [Fusarium duplospermum]